MSSLIKNYFEKKLCFIVNKTFEDAIDRVSGVNNIIIFYCDLQK